MNSNQINIKSETEVRFTTQIKNLEKNGEKYVILQPNLEPSGEQKCFWNDNIVI